MRVLAIVGVGVMLGCVIASQAGPAWTAHGLGRIDAAAAEALLHATGRAVNIAVRSALEHASAHGDDEGDELAAAEPACFFYYDEIGMARQACKGGFARAMGHAIFTGRRLTDFSSLHPDLARVIARAGELSEVDFLVIEGWRNLTRQRLLVATGASRTLRSRHLTGHAVDIVPVIGGRVRWTSRAYRSPLSAFRQAAAELGVAVEFGADWENFRDHPHIQLKRAAYPGTAWRRE